MATPFPCHFDLLSQLRLAGATDALRPSFRRRAAATTTASFPHGGVGLFWQTTTNVPHGGVGWFWEGDRNAARFAGDRGKGDNRRLLAGGQCGHSCLPSHGSGPASRGHHRYGPGDPVGPLVHPTGVGHPLGWAVVSPTIYGWNH